MNRQTFSALVTSMFALLATGAKLQSARAADPPSESRVAVGKELFKSKGSCVFCHGWAGDGGGNPHSPGNASNLRRTQLSRAQLFEVVSCGRPGTAMPHFNAYAYVEDPCYGIEGSPGGRIVPPNPPRPLQPREIDAIIDYLQAKVIGKGPPTRAECIEFFMEPGPCAD
jgi:mono/diheme cytochrome c family protein